MSIRSASANGSRANVRTAPGGTRSKLAGDRGSLASASELPSLGVTGSGFHRGANQSAARARPPLGASASQKGALFGSNGRPPRQGNADAKEDKNNAVITIDDLQRLREQCNLGGAKSELETDHEYRVRERLELQEKSRQRVKNWPNTIENMRNKRLEDKYRKLEEAELERRRIDAEEEEFKQEKRRQAIEAANKKIHDQQDMVKAFHTKLLLCDVVQEREAQLELKKRKEEHEKAVEEGWYENDLIKMEDYDARMNTRMEELHKRKQETAKVVKQQLHDFKISHIKRIKEELLEGELVKRKVQEDLENERVKELERKKNQAKTREELRKANEDLKALKEQIKQREREELQRQNEYALKKERLDQLKKDREEQRFKEKQQVREKMIQRQAEYLAKLQNREEEILNKQVAEAEEKARRLFEEAELKRQQLKEAIERSRKHQLDKKLAEKEGEIKEEREFSNFWKARNDELAVAETMEKEEIRQRQVDLKQFQRSQAELRKKIAEDEFVKDIHEAATSKALLDQKEKDFYSYAEKCINEWQECGKNVKPLIMELKSYKKKAF